MNNSQKINLECLKRDYKQGLLIPEIQRDYVMGAGGKTGNGSDKLDMLLDALLSAYNQKKKFDFSCVITYCRNNSTGQNRLEIYDGQQRLTTLILLYLFCLQREKNEEYKKYKDWYRFCERPIANDIVNKLTEDGFDIDTIEVKDFSSFSMVNLLKRFNDNKFKPIKSEFFLEDVLFDHVSISSQSEIEQFFMDLNSGVKLKEYELYKAKLVHHINCIEKSSASNEAEKKQLKSWVHKLDNEWLNVFLPFSDSIHPSEEYEVAFIRYCFRMLIKAKPNVSNDAIENIGTDILKDCYDIMNSISKLSFSYTETVIPQIVEFSWGNKNEKSEIKKADWNGDVYNKERRCAYWNLSYDNNIEHLSFFIKNVLLESQFDLLETDILIWAYITTLDWNNSYQNEYIRFLKIILNHNVGINVDAWYECQDKGQYLYYARYGVMNIPNYYGIHKDDKKYEMIPNNNEIFNSIYFLVQEFWKNKPIIESDKGIAVSLMERILEKLPEQNRIRSIIDIRNKQIQRYDSYRDFCVYENKYNGVLEKLINIEGYYLGKVILSWPTRGANSYYGLNDEQCFVLLKCHMDKYYSDYCMPHDQIVQTYETRYKNDLEFDKEKCFWVCPTLAYKIMDRTTHTAKTYTVRGGTEAYCWAYRFDGQNPCCPE